MLDTVKVVVPLDHWQAIHGGYVGATDRTGELEWKRARRLQLEGSHDHRLTVLSTPNTVGTHADTPDFTGTLTVEGSFAKFMQGHNVWGSEQMVPMVAATLRRVTAFLAEQGFDAEPSTADLAAWDAGQFEVYRADCTFSMPMRSRAEAIEYIRAAEQTATVTHRGRGQLTKGSTLYFGKESRRWSLKLYSKGQELAAGKGHQLPDSLLRGNYGPALLEHAEPLLRAELVIRRQELIRTGHSRGTMWDADTCRTLHVSHFGRMTMPEHIELPDHLEAELPRRLRATYALHKAGRDTRNILETRTWYRHRRDLLEYGVDLAANAGADPDRSNVVPLVRRITATMDYDTQVPDWARDTSLYFDPTRQTA